jgi:hypothetical protein
MQLAKSYVSLVWGYIPHDLFVASKPAFIPNVYGSLNNQIQPPHTRIFFHVTPSYSTNFKLKMTKNT